MISIPFYLLGMRLMQAAGVALALSLSALLQVGLLYVLWNRQSANRWQAGVYRCYGRVTLLSLVIAPVLEGLGRVLRAAGGPATLAHSMALAAILGLVFVVLLALGGRLLGIAEIDSLWGRIKARWHPKT